MAEVSLTVTPGEYLSFEQLKSEYPIAKTLNNDHDLGLVKKISIPRQIKRIYNQKNQEPWSLKNACIARIIADLTYVKGLHLFLEPNEHPHQRVMFHRYDNAYITTEELRRERDHQYEKEEDMPESLRQHLFTHPDLVLTPNFMWTAEYADYKRKLQLYQEQAAKKREATRTHRMLRHINHWLTAMYGGPNASGAIGDQLLESIFHTDTWRGVVWHWGRHCQIQGANCCHRVRSKIYQEIVKRPLEYYQYMWIKTLANPREKYTVTDRLNDYRDIADDTQYRHDCRCRLCNELYNCPCGLREPKHIYSPNEFKSQFHGGSVVLYPTGYRNLPHPIVTIIPPEPIRDTERVLDFFERILSAPEIASSFPNDKYKDEALKRLKSHYLHNPPAPLQTHRVYSDGLARRHYEPYPWARNMKTYIPYVFVWKQQPIPINSELRLRVMGVPYEVEYVTKLPGFRNENCILAPGKVQNIVGKHDDKLCRLITEYRRDVDVNSDIAFNIPYVQVIQDFRHPANVTHFQGENRWDMDDYFLESDEGPLSTEIMDKLALCSIGKN